MSLASPIHHTLGRVGLISVLTQIYLGRNAHQAYFPIRLGGGLAETAGECSPCSPSQGAGQEASAGKAALAP